MEWHLDLQFPLASPEARAKMRLYPPPQNNGYYTPWLWIDGREYGSGYSTWGSYIDEALTVPADIEVRLFGTYDRMSRLGQLHAEFENASDSAITASAVIVITEDSIQYSGPNGDAWHNHVCRDFVPDHIGTEITVPGLGITTLDQEFELLTDWAEERCNVLVFLQSSTTLPDSTRPVYNSNLSPVLQLTGIAERPARTPRVALSVTPNPCRNRAEFTFTAPAGRGYSLQLLRLDGSLVQRLTGQTAAGVTRLNWERTGPAGVYMYRLMVDGTAHTGKFLLAD